MFDFLKKKKNEIEINMPLQGKVVAIEEVPDPVFAGKMVGDGFAVQPQSGILDVVSPVNGELSMVFDTGHAFGVKMPNGFEVLVHLGIDTVQLEGQGYEILKQQGESVKTGDVIVRMDVDKIRELGKDPITPVIFTNSDMVEEVHPVLGASEGVVCTVKLK